MIREDVLSTILLYVKHSASNDLYKDLIDQIFNDHETAIKILMKANEEEISRHFNECEKYEAQLKSKDEEIEKLKAELDNIGRKLFMI